VQADALRNGFFCDGCGDPHTEDPGATLG